MGSRYWSHCSTALGQLRRCLVINTYAGIEANQLHLRPFLRATQGHHKQIAGVSGAIHKYGRDDVIGQGRFQSRARAAVRKGWVPSVPHARGVCSLGEANLLSVVTIQRPR